MRTKYDEFDSNKKIEGHLFSTVHTLSLPVAEIIEMFSTDDSGLLIPYDLSNESDREATMSWYLDDELQLNNEGQWEMTTEFDELDANKKMDDDLIVSYYHY